MTTPPTRPEPFDPRDFPDPLTVELSRQVDRQYAADWGCGTIVALLFVLVGSSIAATPRSVPIPTTSSPLVDVRPGSAGPSIPATGTSGWAPIGAPQTGSATQASVEVEGSSEVGSDAPYPEPSRRPISGAPPMQLAGGTSYSGSLAFADPSYGPLYLALREPRGTWVEICGPAACRERTSTDFGPIRSLWLKGRIADVSAADFEAVCGVDAAQRILHGLCPGSIQILSRPRLALPQTDGAP